jgi:hypothetical protein
MPHNANISLKEEELQILRTLKFYKDGDYGYVRPMDVGGTNGSLHSRILARLCKHGLVERRRRNTICNVFCNSSRGSYMYAITDAGVSAIDSVTSGDKA